MLVPTLFLMYVNDMPVHINSYISLFSGDEKPFRETKVGMHAMKCIIT